MSRVENLEKSYKKLEQARELKGVTFYRMAQDIGLSPMVFTDWKNKKRQLQN